MSAVLWFSVFLVTAAPRYILELLGLHVNTGKVHQHDFEITRTIKCTCILLTDTVK